MAEEKFDPYYLWLGIPPEEQPPNFYRLLGIRLLEENLDVISTAADRQMAHVRTFQSGQRSQFSQQLLNELAAAKVHLLNADKKVAYDTKLRHALANQKQASQSQAIPVAQALPTEAFPNFIGNHSQSSTRVAAQRARRQKPRSFGAAGLGVALIVFLALVSIAGWAIRKDSASPEKDSPRTGRPEASATNQPHSPVAALSNTVAIETSKTSELIHTEKSDHHEKASSVEPLDRNSNKSRLPAIVVANPSTESLPLDAEPTLTDQLQGNVSEEIQVSNPGNSVPEPQNNPIADATRDTPPSVPRRLPIPDQLARNTKKQSILKLFQVEDGNTPNEKLALARRLLQVARETTDDPTAQYVVLELARAKAIEAGQIKLAFEAIDELGRTFDCDPESLRANSLIEAAKGTVPAPERQQIVNEGMALIDGFIASDEFEKASYLSKVVIPVARKSRDTDLLKSAVNQRRVIDDMAAQYQKARSAFETLKSNPADEQANLAAGRYLAFAKQDWSAGIAHLAKSADPLLSAAAELELAGPQTVEEQLRLADAWWDAAEAEADRAIKARCRAHSSRKYQRLLGQLSGLQKVEVEKRIEVVRGFVVPIHYQARPTSGNWRATKDTITCVTPDAWPGFAIELPTALATSGFEMTFRVRLSSSRWGSRWRVETPDGSVAEFYFAGRGDGYQLMDDFLAGRTTSFPCSITPNTEYRLRCRVQYRHLDAWVNEKLYYSAPLAKDASFKPLSTNLVIRLNCSWTAATFSQINIAALKGVGD